MKATFTSSIILSCILHSVFAVAVGSAFVSCTGSVTENKKPQKPQAISATLSDEKQALVYYEKKRAHQEELKRIARQKEATVRKKRELARKKEAQRVELQKRREVEKKRKAEQVRLEKERVAKKKAQQSAEKRKREEEARQKALDEVEKQKQERLHEQREAQRKAELSHLEIERKEQLRMRKLNLARWTNQYVRNLKSSVESHWKQPPASIKGGECIVKVKQKENGEIVSVDIISCSGDKLYRRSVVEAVWKANPLPPPPVADVFDSEIELTFKKEYGE